jgi:hypothetical protein
MTKTMNCRLALLCCLFAQTALSAPPKKAIGNVHDEFPLDPPAPPRGPDAALLRALGFAFEPLPPEVRVQAIEDLGFLGDPRVLNPLAQLCLDPNPAFARAAVRAIAVFQHPRAEEILSNVIRHPNIPATVKLRAIELLPYQNTWTSIRLVFQIARSATVNDVVLAARRLAAELPQAIPAAPARPRPPGPLDFGLDGGTAWPENP